MSDQSKPGRKPRVTDEEVLAVLRENDDPVLSTAEVADELPIKRRATLTRLQRLAENGVLARKQTGGRNTVWWLTDADEEREAAPDARLKRLSNELGEPIAVGEQVYESGDAHALDAPEGEHPDDRATVKERPPEEIMTELERFLDERDSSDEPAFDPSGADDDVYAREHVENLKQLTTDRE